MQSRPPPTPGWQSHPNAHPSAPPMTAPVGAKRSGSPIGVVLVAASVGVVLLFAGIFATYGVRKYLRNSHIAAARAASEKATPTYVNGRFSDGEPRMSIAFPSKPTITSREEHDGRVKITAASLELGSAQLLASKLEIRAPEMFECAKMLDLTRADSLGQMGCTATSHSRSGDVENVAFECKKNGRTLTGRARHVCDASDVGGHHRGLMFRAMYAATAERFEESEALAFFDSMKTK